MARLGIADMIVVRVWLLAESPFISLGTRAAIAAIVAVAPVLLRAGS